MRKEKLQRNKLRRHLFGDSLGAVIDPDLQNIEIFRFVKISSCSNCVHMKSERFDWDRFKIFLTLYYKLILLHQLRYHIPAASNNLMVFGSPPIVTDIVWLSNT